MMGETISHYRLLEKLGSGGMGVVYAAEDLKLGRKVALKFLAKEYSHDPVALYRFQREARSASALNHPNICTIYEIDEFNGDRFIAMELLKGVTLKDRLLRGIIPGDQLIEFAIQILSGLEAAHSEGIIHRDVKPANIFVTTHGYVKLLDFGVAKLSAPRKGMMETLAGGAIPEEAVARDLTVPGEPLGTVVYMSPEQALGEPLDVRTDLFSFGAVLYEIATGKQAFRENTAAGTVDAILHKTPLPTVRFNSAIPSELQFIITKALEKDRNLRYQTASDLSSDLQRIRSDLYFSPSLLVAGNDPTETLPQVARKPARSAAGPAVEPPRRQKKRGLSLAAAAVTIIVAASLTLWWRVAAVRVEAAQLRIQTNSGAQVLIDEQVSGTVGPDRTLTLKVPPGKHTVQLRLKGYELYSTSVAINNGEVRSLIAEMKPAPPPLPPPARTGNLSVRSNVRGADVLVNGQLRGFIGNDNTFKTELDEGTYNVQLKKSGYKDSLDQPVEILAQKQNQIAFTLAASGGPELSVANTYLLIRSKPGVEIRIDGKVSGIVANDGTFPVKVDPGQHLVQASFSGYQPYSSSVPVKAKGTTYLVVDLKPSAVVVTSFTASRARITTGQTANLKWTTQHATAVRIDPEIGDVLPSGALDVSPAKATTYVLTAKGSGGKATAETYIAVEPNPTDVEAISQTLARLKGAYDSMDINALRREWPSLTQIQSDAIETTFVGLMSLRLNDDCDGLPMISGDTAEWMCTETLRYVIKGRHQIPDVHNTVVYYFKRGRGRWYIDRRQGGR